MRDKAVEEAIACIELEVGRLGRQRTVMMDSLLEIRNALQRIEKEIGKHDRWERRRANGE